MALDLSVPPWSLLVAAWGALLGLTLIAGRAPWFSWPIALLAASGMLLFVALSCAWIGFARRECSLFTLLFAPWYLITYLPQYLSYFVERRAPWIKTQRDASRRDGSARDHSSSPSSSRGT
jgi:hypothetical protein